VIQAEAASKKALLDAKDVMRGNRKRKNSSKNTSKLSQSFVTFLCIANRFSEAKAGKAGKAGKAAAGAAAGAVAGAGAGASKKSKRNK
jgi:hypothetical protein